MRWSLRFPSPTSSLRLVVYSTVASSVLLGLAGCGGGGATTSSGSGGGSGTTGTPSVPKGASALFQVDVATGKVTIIPAKSTSSSTVTPNSIFSGTSITFNSGVLLDQPSTLGLKTLSISLTNNWALPIGQNPDGGVTGLKVLVSSIGNSTGIIDLRPYSTVSTLAGTGAAGSTGGPVSTATFSTPTGAAAGNGAIYIAESGGNRIRKIQNGFVSTLAGSGAASEVDGTGTSATFSSPYGLCVNPTDGSIIVADLNGNKIRRVTADGRVTTIAGTGAATSTDGAGGSATTYGPTGVAISPAGVIYISEAKGNKIRSITLTGSDPSLASSYQVATLAGSSGTGSADGTGTAATFYHPLALAYGKDGALYVADQGNNKIRRVSTTGEVVTIAGTGSATSLDGTGGLATINSPKGIAAVNGALIVGEQVGNRLRQLSLNGDGSANPTSANSWLVTTVAGTGTSGATNGTGDIATFNSPQLIAADKSGNIIVPQIDNRIRLVSPSGGVFPIGIPSGTSSADQVKLSNPDGFIPNNGTGIQLPYMAYSGGLASGATTVARNWNFVVPSGTTSFQFTVTVEADSTTLTPPEGGSGVGSTSVSVRTLAGGGSRLGYVNGLLNEARFNGPEYLAQDSSGNIYASDQYNCCVRRISADGMVSTVAGTSLTSAFADGVGTAAKFSYPSGIAVSPDGKTIYVADSVNNRIRRIAFIGGDPTNAANWSVSTIAGTGAAGGTYTNSVGTTATFNSPSGLCLSPGGTLYMTESVGSRVRRITFQGGDPSSSDNWLVSLVAGDTSSAAPAGGDVDSTSGGSATFNHPAQIAFSNNGMLYVTDSTNHRIRAITIDGVVTTLAGGVSGDTPVGSYVDGTGAAAHFSSPSGIAVDTSGNIYVSDSTDNHIRLVSPTGVVTTVAGTGTTGSSDGLGNVATFNNPVSLMISKSGTLYVGSVNDNSIRIVQRIVGQGTL